MIKRILPLLAIAAISLASCKKERTCTCTTTSSQSGSSSTTSTVTYKDAKKSDARVACLSHSYVDSNNNTITTKCDLK